MYNMFKHECQQYFKSGVGNLVMFFFSKSHFDAYNIIFESYNITHLKISLLYLVRL